MRRKTVAGNHRDGAAAVEFAVVSPVLVLIVLGLIDTGCLLMTQAALTHAARDGVRHAVMDDHTLAETFGLVQDQLRQAGISGARVDVFPDPTQATVGESIRVAIDVRYGDVSWFQGVSPFSGVDLRSHAVMRSERVH